VGGGACVVGAGGAGELVAVRGVADAVALADGAPVVRLAPPPPGAGPDVAAAGDCEVLGTLSGVFFLSSPPLSAMTARTTPMAMTIRATPTAAGIHAGLDLDGTGTPANAGAAGRLGLEPGDPRAAAVVLDNPLSEDQAVLRPTILVSLLDVARHNRTRGAESLRIFETGTVFRDQPDPVRPDMPYEHLAIAALVQDDLFAAKGLLEALMDGLRIDDWSVEATADVAFLHPGRAARVTVGSGENAVVVGLLGEVHPRVAGRWDLPRVATFLVDLDTLLPLVPEQRPFRPVGAFPDARFDLAVLVADDVTAARVVAVARKAGGALLEDVSVFDSYRGKGVPEGQVSLALHVRLRAADRTLTEDEIGGTREAIVSALAEQVGGVLRG
jgi:phenylalanyl-tRNA synthetase beta chain